MSARKAGKSKWSQYVRPDGTFDFKALSDTQKEAFYKECEAVVPAAAKPLTSIQRATHTRARRRGRPRRGQGSTIVSLSIEKGLLREAERLAKAEGLTRSDVFSRG